MEGISLLKILFVLLFCFGSHASAGRAYFKHFLGHIHENPSKNSTSLTTIQCSQSVKILKNNNQTLGWSYVKAGEDKGFIRTEFLTEKRPNCLQAKYPKFYNHLNLSLSDMYYWGRLYDQYLMGKSKIK